jgi:hypothetical protein
VQGVYALKTNADSVSEVMTFRVDKVLARAIRRAAQADGRRVSPFLRRLIAKALHPPRDHSPEAAA